VTVLPALLVASAVGVLLSHEGPPRRLATLLPLARESGPAGVTRRTPARHQPLCLAGGLGVWLMFGGAAGLLLGTVLVVAGPRLLARLEHDDEAQEVAARLPLALELLGACLAGGAVPAEAVRAVSVAVPGPCGARLAKVAAALAVGSAPAEAWCALGDDRGPAGAAARALARAADGGAPVAAAVLRVAEQARRDAGAVAERRARRAGVLAVGPLGLCFLPAFVLLGVVPAVMGLAAPLLASL
jgi:hypothetical protein